MAKRKTALIPKDPQLKKNVAAIHTSGELTLVQRKMANVLLLNAYDHLRTRRTHSMPIALFREMLGWDDSNRVDALKEAITKLVTTPIEFNVLKQGKDEWKTTAMLSFGEISGGMVTYRYDEYLAERLYEPEVFSMINLRLQRRFEGSYALTLYENTVRFRDVLTTGMWDIPRFRRIIGATAGKYDEFKYLRRDVILKAIDEINRVSDIFIEARYEKNGRSVVGVAFDIKPNPQMALLNAEISPEQEEIKNKEIFKRLIALGISERLAMFWIATDETRLNAVVEYVEELAESNKIKSSAGGYIRKLFEGDAVVSSMQKAGKKKDGVVPEVSSKEKALWFEEFKREQVRGMIAELDVPARRRMAADFSTKSLDEKRASTFNDDICEFEDKKTNLEFMIYMRAELGKTLTESDFDAWLASKRNTAPLTH